MRIENTGPGHLPMIYIVDASIDVTGGFICARNEARLLNGIAHVTLVLPAATRIAAEELQPFAKVLRLPLVNLRRSVRSFVLYLPALLITSWRLRRHLRADRAERLQLNDFYLMHGAVCRLLGYRGQIVTWIRFDPRRYGRLLSGLWLSLGSRTSNRMVAVSRFIQSILPPPIQTVLLYDAPPDSPASQPGDHGIIAAEPRILIYIGNYIQGKGQDDAIMAFSAVADRFPDLELHFHGGDMGLEKNRAYRTRLEQQAQRSGFSERIRFHNFTRNPTAVLHTAYAALNFSHSESFSMTVLEASAAGLPVIATRSGGPTEIIEDGLTGLLVPVGDVGAMQAAIIDLSQDPARAYTMGAAGHQLVRDRFSKEKYLAGLKVLFDI